MRTNSDNNSDKVKAITLKDIVNMKGNNLNRTGTPNSVSIIISCIGWINKLLSTNKLEPIPIKISLVMKPKNIENKANITKGEVKKKSPSWAGL